MKGFLRSFLLAIRGVAYCICTGRNFRVQMVAGLYVLLISPFFLTSTTQWAVVLVLIGLILMVEILNTVLETVIDRVSAEYSRFARAAKDASAGAVFVLAVTSVVVAILFFADLDKLRVFFSYMAEKIWYPVLLGVLLVLSLVFIALGPLGIRRAFRKLIKNDRTEQHFE